MYLHYLLVGGIHVSVAYVVHDGSLKDKAVLHHHAHLSAKGFYRYILKVMSVHKNLSAVGIVEPAQKIHDGGFSCSSRAYYGNTFTGFNCKVDVIQNPDAFVIAEVYVLVFNLSDNLRKFTGTIPVRDF